MQKKEITEKLKELKQRYDCLQEKLNLKKTKKDFEEFQIQMNHPDFWKDQKKAQEITQRSSLLKKKIEICLHIESQIQSLQSLLPEAGEDDFFSEGITETEKHLESIENLLLLSGPYDHCPALLSIHVGNGGKDAEDFCQTLLRMYIRFGEQQKWKPQILEESTSDAGLKSALVRFEGLNAYGFLKSEQGVHRLIRLSPFNAKNLRQTSFAKIEVVPEINHENEVTIENKDLKIDVFRSSGAGGQSVNTTDSAVRITYLPLNLVVTCQNERSQIQNKETALKVLQSKLLQLKIEQHAQDIQEIRGENIDADFSSQIRTYTLQPYQLVKDHRTNCESSNPEDVFDGNIQKFIDAFLVS